MNRREFIYFGTSFALVGKCIAGDGDVKKSPIIRFGMVTDIHYAERDINWLNRHYRKSVSKLEDAISVFNERKVDFAIELGDMTDKSKTHEETMECLERIEGVFAKFNGPRYHVAGNHDFEKNTIKGFFSRVPNDGKVCERGYYAFEKSGVKFIVLDACYKSNMKHYDMESPWVDTNVPPEQVEWLEKELASAAGQVVIFCHQRLDESADPLHLVKNSAVLRSIFEKSGKVKAVFTGHEHKGGSNFVNGIHYYSLPALVEGERNTFAEVSLYADGTFTVTGWRKLETNNPGEIWYRCK